MKILWESPLLLMTATSLQRLSSFFFYHLNPLIKITKGNLQKTLISHDLPQCSRRIRPIGKGFVHWVWSNVCLGYVHTILLSLSCCHKKLSSIGWTPIRYVTLNAGQLRSVTEIAPKSLFLCVNKSPIRYGFRAGAKPPGGGTPHMKGVGMLVGNFELNP